MFTLKIKWMRYEYEENDSKLADETTLFIPADQVMAHSELTSLDHMKAWEEGSYQNYTVLNREGTFTAKLIQVDKDEMSTWYLASHAWLLGPDGKTIERLI